MREVAVIGVGMTQFGKHTDRTIRELGEEALWAALTDAGVAPKDVQVAYVGNALGRLSGQEMIAGQILLREVGITSIPITRVEDACASASFAFRESWLSVASGLYDVAMAVGVDPIHFGIIITVNLTIGMITPPVGVVLFVTAAIAKLSIREMMRDLVPMIAILVGVLALVTYWPGLVMFIPNLLR